MSWYLAPSLARLRSQVDRRWPNRSKVSDGSIGDAAHTTRASDHNPDPKTGVVRALDITTPQTAQGKQIGEAILAATWQDPRTFYVIWRRKIYYRGETKPRAYNGLNAHQNHIHVSIDRKKKSAETDTTNWKGLGMAYMSSPMLGRFTSGYNLNRYITLNGKRVFSPHKGIDIAPPVAGTVGTPVYAMFDGTVTKVVSNRKPGQPYNQGATLHYGYSGNGPRIDNPDGEFQIYVHVKSVVKVGQKVKAGDLIGYTDRSGTQTGPHVHVSTFTASGVEYDPIIVFNKYGVTPGEAPQTTTATSKKEDWFTMATKKELRTIVREELSRLLALRVNLTGAAKRAFNGADSVNVGTLLRHAGTARNEALDHHTDTAARLQAQSAAIKALAAAQGNDSVDVAAVVNAAVEKALADLQVTLTVDRNDIEED